MKWLTIAVLLSIAVGFPNNIAKINRLKSEAHKAYVAGDYQSALEKYGILIDSFQVDQQEVLMNYANAAFLATHTANSPIEGLEGPENTGPAPGSDQSDTYRKIAQETYTRLAQTASPSLQSQAFNQLGVMAFNSAPPPKPGKDVLQQAQGLFKSALITDQSNEQARFNYELVTKMLEQAQQQQEEQQQDQEQDQQEDQQQDQEQEQQQQQQDQQQQEQQQSGDDQNEQQEGQQEDAEEQEGEPKDSEQQQSEQPQGEEQPEEQELNASPEKMEELKISEEKARMILEAMKNSEVQYIQQNQKKATKRPDSSKPDW